LLAAREFSVATSKVSESLRTTPIDMAVLDIILWRCTLLQLEDWLVGIILEDKILNIAVFSTFKEESCLKALSGLLNTKVFSRYHRYIVTDCNTFVNNGGNGGEL
jgi:hypothetical protein